MQRRRLRRLQRRSLLLTECFRVFGFSAQRPALGRIRLWQRVRTVFPNAEHCVRCGFRWDDYGMRYERGRISGGRFGLPDAAVKEARERVRSAIKTNGMKFPVSRLTVNLAPADTRKAGTLYDLPVLLGILCATGEIRQPRRRFSARSASRGRCALSPARSRWRSRPSRSASRSSMSRRATRPRPPLPTM